MTSRTRCHVLVVGVVVVGMDHNHMNQPAISVRNLTKTWASGVPFTRDCVDGT